MCSFSISLSQSYNLRYSSLSPHLRSISTEPPLPPELKNKRGKLNKNPSFSSFQLSSIKITLSIKSSEQNRIKIKNPFEFVLHPLFSLLCLGNTQQTMDAQLSLHRMSLALTTVMVGVPDVCDNLKDILKLKR